MKNLKINAHAQSALALAPVLAIASLLSLSQPAAAAVVTGFETAEGFYSGEVLTSSTTIPGETWSINSADNRSYVTGDQHFAGDLSLAMQNAAGGVTAARKYTADPAAAYTTASYSFISPDASFGYNTSLSRVVISLADSSGKSVGYVDLRCRFGTSSSNSLQIGYTYDQSKYLYANVSLNPAQWNTISLVVDYGAKTYDINLNGTTVFSDVAMPASWTGVPASISQVNLSSATSQTATPGQYATVYYDNIVVAVPEPSSAKTLMGSALLLGGWCFLKRLKSGQTMFTR